MTSGLDTNTGAAKEPRSRAPSKTEPDVRPRLVVAQDGTGGHASISSAIAAAVAGDTIMVQPGIYRESLVLGKAVTVMSTFRPESVVVEHPGDEVVRIVASGVRLVGLTVRPQRHGNDSGVWSAVWIKDAEATVEQCHLSSHLGATLWVGGRSSHAIVRQCRIVDGAQNGVAIMEEGSANVERCSLAGHRWPAIFVAGQCRASVTDCEIVDNSNLGIVAFDGSRLTATQNRVRRNASGGIALVGAAPGCEVSDNDVSDNRGLGIGVSESLAASLTNNRLAGNAIGLYFAEGSSGEAFRNEIRGCTEHGVIVEGAGTSVQLGENTVQSSGGWGIVVAEGATARLRMNRVGESARSAALIRGPGTRVDATGNILGGSGAYAVEIGDEARATFRDNDLRGNAVGPWLIHEAGALERQGNLE